MLLAALTLSGLFTDHMVLQRGRANAVWGADQPRQVITLTVEGVKKPLPPVQVTVDADGNWMLACPELPAGGPYRLRVKGTTEQVIDDVLVGDVWLASGQSNMELPLARVNQADREIATAQFPAIRVAKIPLITARTPLTDVTTEWQVANPTNASSFTAVGYFFARELHQKTGIPIGIIDSTWGGTRVEAWASREGLRAAMPELDATLTRLAAADPELPRIRAEYAAKLAVWSKDNFPQDTENLGAARGWQNPDFDDRAWRTMSVPNSWQAQGSKVNGAVWFRLTLNVPAAAAGRELTLHLGAIDDFDTTYFNGEKVGAIGEETPNYFQVHRHYKIPGQLVRAGANTIAIRVFDNYGEGGLLGPASGMYTEMGNARVPLAGQWRWQFEREIPLVSSEVFGRRPAAPPELDAQNTPTALFNGMIAPLIPYGLRGFIWYQGEANVSNHASYRDRFTAMVRDWRARWGQGTLPFYFVQLAAFTENSGWPYLREAQTAALSEPETGMALAIDIGESHDIHPRNKQDVGHRLALLARTETYGEKNLIASGPTFTRSEIKDRAVRIHWNSAGGLRTRDNAKTVTGFALAGADGRYHPAEARIEGETVVVTSAAVPAPQTVRYAWADFPVVNLENASGLPAAPFRTDSF